MAFFPQMLRNLLDRRVPQYLAVYIGGSLGAVQSIEWLTGRYGLSPHLPDLWLIILAALLPAVALLAYNHGRQGAQAWTRFQRLFVPANVVLAIVVAAFSFFGKPLGKATQLLTLQDESGVSIEREIPKAAFQRRIVLFGFVDEQANAEPWLAGALVGALQLDLDQDPSLTTVNLLHHNWLRKEVERAGYQANVRLPLAVQQRLAKTVHADFFLDGQYRENEHGLVLQVRLHRVDSGKLIAQRDIEGVAPLPVIDRLTVQLREDMDVPAYYREHAQDLPVAEMMSERPDALREFAMAERLWLSGKEFDQARQHMLAAVQADPSFALAHYYLVWLHTALGEGEAAKQSAASALQYGSRLPEKWQLMTKSIYYQMHGEHEKLLPLYRMWVELYPNHMDARLRLASLLMTERRYDEALNAYEQVLKMVPDPFEHYQTLARIHENKGDEGKARDFYERYAQHYPDQAVAYHQYGHALERWGDFPAAQAQYEKALLLEPRSSELLAHLGSVAEGMGRFDEALSRFTAALAQSQKEQDKDLVLKWLIRHHERRGQMGKALAYVAQQEANSRNLDSPLSAYTARIFNSRSYARAGKSAQGMRVLQELANVLKPPHDGMLHYGYLQIHLENRDAEAAERHLKALSVLDDTVYDNQSMQEWREYCVGELAELRGEHGLAIKQFNAYLERRHNDPEALMHLGRNQRIQGQYDEAQKSLAALLKLSPFEPQANVELALLLAARGEREQARHHLQTALDVWADADPDYLPAQQARATLTALGSGAVALSAASDAPKLVN